jgi:MFS family permease
MSVLRTASSAGAVSGTSTPLLVCVLAFAVLMNMVSRGYGETFAVFLLPLSGEFGWSRTTLTGAYSMYMVGYGLCAPLTGQLYSRFGPRVTFAVGLTVLGFGFAVAGSATSAGSLYTGLGLMGAVGASAIGMIATSSLIRPLFPGRLTTALGIAHAGLGTGVFILSPLSQLLVDSYGWRQAYFTLGGIAISLVLIVLMMPWGTLGRAQARTAEANTRQGEKPWTVRNAARTVPFWGLFSAFYFTSAAIFILAPQFVAYLVSVGFDPLEAAGAFGTSGLLSISGMVGVAWASERFGRTIVVTLSYAASAIGMCLMSALQWWPSWWLLGLALAFLGITSGCRAPIITELVARLFPGEGYASVLGGIHSGMGLGAGMGALLGAWIIDSSGTYHGLFYAAVGALAIASGMFIVLKPLRTGRWD